MLNEIKKTLFVDARYKLYLSGLQNTVIISLGALALGLFIGMLLAVIKYNHKKFGKFKMLNAVADVYIYIIRGTPVVLQLMLMYFVILLFIKNGITVAIITFGVNSAAYVAEIIRGGLEAVDDGQMEAGRSLGLSLFSTMRYIILPQAVKKALPPLGNEFIALIKETSVVGYIAILDVTFAASRIQSRTLSAFTPLIVSAVIYLILVYALTLVLRLIERGLRKSDRN